MLFNCGRMLAIMTLFIPLILISLEESTLYFDVIMRKFTPDSFKTDRIF